jgi:hypothetical protein
MEEMEGDSRPDRRTPIKVRTQSSNDEAGKGNIGDAISTATQGGNRDNLIAGAAALSVQSKPVNPRKALSKSSERKNSFQLQIDAVKSYNGLGNIETIDKANEKNLKKLMNDFVRKPKPEAKQAALHEDRNNLRNLGAEANDSDTNSSIPLSPTPWDSEELNITINDGINSFDILLRSHVELFSKKFKVVIRDSVSDGNNTDVPKAGGNITQPQGDAGKVVEVLEDSGRKSCVYVGQSGKVQVALSNCDGDGFVSSLFKSNNLEFEIIVE